MNIHNIHEERIFVFVLVCTFIMVIKNFEIKVDVQKGSQRFKGKNDTWMLFLLKFNDINLGLDYYELHFMNKKNL